MPEIQIRLPSDDCDELIQLMRRWLTAHHCEPRDFSVHDLEHQTTVVVVDFMTESELGSFAEQFAAEDGD
jgi:hypothetical protein